ncbi:alpha/beta hydrolase [Defluviimonas sp. WL0002]|uniref:Alpha/beta hydrolase n=1 Tax=Albidovulum marisflavi TaxID=2984159 RepID=A0ABT2ZGA5_9RHOB|nr:alpha/beta hydrolase [Defluviimonas sp. WL0002]MCV2870167.1 alpha/beta hydrolase [Defluviimonas sp. WL0002]
MSIRLRLLNAGLKSIVKPSLRRQSEPTRARAAFEIVARLAFARPRGVAIRRSEGCGMTPPAVRFTPPEPAAKVLLYFHGGGFVAGSPRTHGGMLAHLARGAGIEVCAPDYRLAPEHPFPAAWDDARAAWDALIDDGLSPCDIALGGDSAGGGLALSLLADLCREGMPPAATIVFSPLTDMTGSGASIQKNAGTEVLLPFERFDELMRMALGPHDPEDPRASPLFADFPSCSRVFFAVSDAEGLFDDSARLFARLKSEGVRTELHIGRACPHAWPIFAGRLAEADETLRVACGFLRNALGMTAMAAELR